MDYIASSIYGLGSFPPTHTHTNTKVPGRVVCVLSSSCNPQKTKTKLAGMWVHTETFQRLLTVKIAKNYNHFSHCQECICVIK